MATTSKERDALFQREAMPHVDSLFGAAMRFTRSRRDAEDLVQDTLLKAFVHFDKYKPGTNCKAWLFRILTNTFINRYRKTQRERVFLSEDSDAWRLDERVEARQESELEPREESQVEQIGRIFGDEVNEALQRIPLDFRTVVICVDVEDFSYKETAEILDCPIGTVMSRLYRGRRMLRAQLAEYAVEEGYIRDLSEDYYEQITNDRGGSQPEITPLRRAGGE